MFREMCKLGRETYHRDLSDREVSWKTEDLKPNVV